MKKKQETWGKSWIDATMLLLLALIVIIVPNITIFVLELITPFNPDLHICEEKMICEYGTDFQGNLKLNDDGNPELWMSIEPNDWKTREKHDKEWEDCNNEAQEVCLSWRPITLEEKELDYCNDNLEDSERCFCEELDSKYWILNKTSCSDCRKDITWLKIVWSKKEMEEIANEWNERVKRKFNITAYYQVIESEEKSDVCTKARPKTECEKGNEDYFTITVCDKKEYKDVTNERIERCQKYP